MESKLDVDPYDGEFWYPDHGSYLKSIELDSERQKLFQEFADSRLAKGPLAERVSKEDEQQAFEIHPHEYRQVKLRDGRLEYLDNDPVSSDNT